MSHRNLVKFCPLCATRLVRHDDHGKRRLACPQCGFIYYRNPAPAAGVLVHREGRVLLVKRRFEPRAGAWCIPAGFMEYGETPRRCAARELYEETGLRARLGELFGVYAGFDDPRVRAVLVLYIAHSGHGALRPGDDAIEARFFPLAHPPRDIAFAAHRQALREFAIYVRRLEAAAPSRTPAATRARSARRNLATPPRLAHAARPRSRRA